MGLPLMFPPAAIPVIDSVPLSEILASPLIDSGCHAAAPLLKIGSCASTGDVAENAEPWIAVTLPGCKIDVPIAPVLDWSR